MAHNSCRSSIAPWLTRDSSEFLLAQTRFASPPAKSALPPSGCTPLRDIFLVRSSLPACAWASGRLPPRHVSFLPQGHARQFLARIGLKRCFDHTMQLLVNCARSAGFLASFNPKDLLACSRFFFARETVLVDYSGSHSLADTPPLPSSAIRHREEAGLQDYEVLRILSPTQSQLCSFVDSCGQLVRSSCSSSKSSAKHSCLTLLCM